MTPNEQKKAAREFAAYWKDKGYEKGQTHAFWLSLLRDVFGVEHPEQFIQFEDPVLIQHMSFIDGYIPASRVMIEQKGSGKDLRKGIRQSDGSILTPFQQAQRYIPNLPVELHPRYIIACNFQTFLIYDMSPPLAEPAQVQLADLEKEYYRLAFIAEGGEKPHLKREVELSVKAGELVGKLYDALYRQYAAVLGDEKGALSADVLRDLNKLCVRLVFCFYAEDAGVFGRKDMFHDYLASFHVEHARGGLVELFKILDQPESERDPFLNEALAAFPYVNGGLFSGAITIPRLDQTILGIILDDCCDQFDWSEISPTIFGAVFESTLNPETRRSGGMHYTSIENIHKVIDPLFLDALKDEYAGILELKTPKARRQRLAAFQDKLATLTFFDPACGSGNFLTETYLSLRAIENDLLREQFTGGDEMGGMLLADIKVSISQFYGIEINDFAVAVAKTALWIAESQMMNVTESIIGARRDFLPLKTNANIVEGNALKLDWARIVPPEKLSYIMGNPPFVGYSLQTPEQKADMLRIYADENGRPYKTAGKIDYVAGWYFKAAQMIAGGRTRAAFVSTNSITQGEQVAAVWKPLYDRFSIHIDFAHRTFRWDSEASLKAHVHCVIVGFSAAPNPEPKKLYDGGQVQSVTQISPYLIAGELVFIEARSRPLCDVPALLNGGKPVEGGFLILTEEEKDELLKAEPQAEVFLRPYMMGKDFIDRKTRWCLWLVNTDPALLRKCPCVLERVEKVREFRLESKKEATRRTAETPTLFQEVRECVSDYVAIPKVSSEQRRYIPMEYLSAKIIPGDSLFMLPDSTLYHLGVLTSNVHMAWMRAACGRLKSDYRYSNTLVYSTFPWPHPTPEQRVKIEAAAQAILDARAAFPDSSLADLYDDLTMPPALRRAHQENDKAVMNAYGFDWRTMTESACVAELMKLYTQLTQK